MTNYPRIQVVSVTWPIFYILDPQLYLSNGEAKDFKFRVLIDTDY